MTTTPTKVVFVGDTNVGKTSIINRYTKSNELLQATVTARTKPIDVNVRGQWVGLLIYDTPGNTIYNTIIPIFLREARIIVVVFDLCRKETLENVPKWVDAVSKIEDKCQFILVGNKLDCSDFNNEASKIDSLCPDLEFKDRCLTSAVTGAGITELFDRMAEVALKLPHDEKCDDLQFNEPEVAVRERNDSCGCGI
jgi:small GTP-binding protein